MSTLNRHGSLRKEATPKDDEMNSSGEESLVLSRHVENVTGNDLKRTLIIDDQTSKRLNGRSWRSLSAKYFG